MKKLLLYVLFSFVFVMSCQAPQQQELEQTETELVLLYYCDGTVQDTCYKDLKTGQAEKALPTNGYFFVGWDSPETILFSEYNYSYDEVSVEYYLFDTKTDAMECITCDLEIIGSKELSPSRQKVAIYHDDRIEIMALSNPAETEAEISGFDFVSSVIWSPDESFIIFLGGQTRVYRFNIRDQSLLELVNEPSAIQIFEPELSPAGDKLAFYLLDENNKLNLSLISVDGTGYRVLADLTPKTITILGSENSGMSFTWSPNGARIAYTIYLENEAGYLNKDGIYVVDLKGGAPVLIDGSPTIKWSLTWSPDGSLLAFVGDPEDGEQDIWTIAPDGTNLLNQTNTPGRWEFGPDWK